MLALIRIQKRGRCQIEQKRGGSGQTRGKEQVNDLKLGSSLLFLRSSNVTQIARLNQGFSSCEFCLAWVFNIFIQNLLQFICLVLCQLGF